MIIAVLIVLGLCLGSFVNALVWRVHEQEDGSLKFKTKKSKALGHKLPKHQYSILHGRSMCPHCKHTLATKDLVPVLSWLSLRGKCRYCQKPVAFQYPLVELLTAVLFLISYIYWPQDMSGLALCFQGVSATSCVLLGLWLILLTGLIALLIYDLRWMLLPNRIMYPLSGIASLYAAISIAASTQPLTALLNTLLAVLVGGGIFYVLFQASKGKWIGGGDVKLGWLLGLVVGTPARSILFIFIAALFGSIISLTLMATKRLKRSSLIPFGPFLIVGAIITQLFGAHILHWYQHAFLNF